MNENPPQQYQQPMPPGYMPPPPDKKKWPYVLLGLVVGVIVIIVAISVCFIVAVGKGVDKAEEVGLIGNETHEGSVGEPVKCGNGLILTVHSKHFSEGDTYTHAQEGFTFVVLDLSFENAGSETEAVSSALEMTVKDADGKEYNATYITSEEPLLAEGDIVPGETVRGNIAFKVPENAKGLVFKFSPLLGDSAFISL